MESDTHWGSHGQSGGYDFIFEPSLQQLGTKTLKTLIEDLELLEEIAKKELSKRMVKK